MHKRILPLAAGLVLLIAGGLVHGVWTQRWRPSDELREGTARLGHVPLTVESWRGEDLPMNAEMVDRAGLAACWTRRYVHGPTDLAVTAVLMCGRAGPIAAHTPEWCYGGAGYVPSSASSRFQVPAPVPAAEFWTADFCKPGPVEATRLRIFWAWGVERSWTAPDNPRLTLARRNSLYKLYVLREMSGREEPVTPDPCIQFLQAVLPVLDRTLY